MVDSTKMMSFNQKIDEKVLKAWRETINRNESVKERLDEAIRDNTQKHLKTPKIL